MVGNRSRSRSRGWASIAIVVALLAGGPAGSALADHVDHEREDEWHITHTVNATVVDNYATVRVGVEIVNEGPDPEFPFRVDLPEDAYVTGLTVTRDGETYEADIQAAEEARERYEKAREEHRSAGLVEEADEGVYAYNINVEGTETVQATLTYERYVTADGGVYELGLRAPATQRGIDEGATIEAHVQHRAGLETLQAAPEAEITRSGDSAHVVRHVDPRGQDEASDLRVRYELAQTPPGGAIEAAVEDGTGYFAHRFRASEAMDRVPVDVALVLDTSGSMKGDKIAQLEQATRRLVDDLEPGDRLALTFFADDTDRPWEGFESVDANTTDRAFDALERMRATGSTNIEQAIADGFAPLGDPETSVERLPVVAFLTDGRPTTGVTGEHQLRTAALEANDAGAHVFSLAFGADADWGLVHGLAQDGEGLARHVQASDHAEVELGSFLTALTTPVLTDVQLDHTHAEETWRVGAPVLFAGGELLYVGTFDPNRTTLEAQVTARDDQGRRSWNVSEAVEETNASYLPDLVAYQRIQALEDQIQAEGGNATLEERALELALEHGFVTDQTSLVVDLPTSSNEEPELQTPEHEPTDAADATRGAQPADGSATDGADEPTEADEQPARTPGVGAALAVALPAIGAAIARSRP
jgi:Mg-chelatase subunit ChlD